MKFQSTFFWLIFLTDLLYLHNIRCKLVRNFHISLYTNQVIVYDEVIYRTITLETTQITKPKTIYV